MLFVPVFFVSDKLSSKSPCSKVSSGSGVFWLKFFVLDVFFMSQTEASEITCDVGAAYFFKFRNPIIFYRLGMRQRFGSQKNWGHS